MYVTPFSQKCTGAKLVMYPNKPDGRTKSLLIEKLTNLVDVSVRTLMRGAKEVLRSGRKALACANLPKVTTKMGTSHC